jgi:hypothetical protein
MKPRFPRFYTTKKVDYLLICNKLFARNEELTEIRKAV